MHIGSIQFRLLGVLAIGSVCALIACGGGGGAPPAGSSAIVAPASITLLLAPSAVTLDVNAQTQFTVTFSGGGGDPSSVVWSAQRGAITSTGLYTAPATAGSDTVTAYSPQVPNTFATAAVTVTAPVAAGPAVQPPATPTLTGPVELQMSSGPYTASVALASGLRAQWTITGGLIQHGANLDTVQFETGSDPFVTLTCTVSNEAGSASASRWMVAVPFAPRDHLADLKQNLAANSGPIATEITSGNAGTYYTSSYTLHGMAAAVEATADTEVMDALVGYINQMIDLAQPLVRNGVTYQEWGPWDVNGNPQQLMTFQATVPLARTAAIIAGNPAFRTRYAASFKKIVDYVDQSIFKYWFDKQTGIYADPSSSWLGGIVPWLSQARGGWGTYPAWSDKCSHFGTMAAWMYQATRNPLYQEYATRIAEDFKTHVTVVNGCWIWDYGKVPLTAAGNQDGSPDTSHANREPMMMVAMHEAGITFKLADLQGMAATLTDLIWNQSTTSPMFTNYISGGNSPCAGHPAWGNGNVYLGWNMLGKYSQKVSYILALIDQEVRVTAASGLNLSLSSNGTRYGLIEMAGTQVRNGAR